MKTLFVYSAFLLFSAINYGMDLEYIRNHYQQAVSDKKMCEAMITELEKNSKNSVHLAYLGGLQSIWANHVGNPFSKLSTFKRGKTNIEKAVNSDSDNVEIRLIRLSVQKNCPAFLGYSKNIKEDEQFIIKHKEKINSSGLIQLYDSVLKK